MASTSSAHALKTFEIENDIIPLSKEDEDAIYKYDAEEQRQMLASRPWRKDPKYFERVRISSIALVRMAMHARSGGSIEVMGVMTGKIIGRDFVVMDAYPLPVEGTETRVNALAEAYEYMVQYLESLKAVGRDENIVGWYHSHPGYGCWLSGIDVGTQHQNQQFQDPFLAIVVDPNRTVSAGRVDIGAFRTYPENFQPARANGDIEYVPLDKVDDFGVHSDRYYALEVSYFRSTLDAQLLQVLWDKYWTSVLGQSPLVANHDYATKQIADVAARLGDVRQPPGHGAQFLARDPAERKSDAEKIVAEAGKIGTQQLQGLVSRNLRNRLFAASGSS